MSLRCSYEISGACKRAASKLLPGARRRICALVLTGIQWVILFWGRGVFAEEARPLRNVRPSAPPVELGGAAEDRGTAPSGDAVLFRNPALDLREQGRAGRKPEREEAPEKKAREMLEQVGFGLSPGELARAVTVRSPELVALFLQAGVNVDGGDREGRTPLMAALATDQWGLAEQLIAGGASPGAADWKGRTPLMLAAIQGKAIWVERLLESGANPAARDAEGHGAVHHAMFAGRLDLLGRLLPLDPHAGLACCQRGDLLHHALEQDSWELLACVLEGVPPQAEWSPQAAEILEDALEQGDREKVRLLLARHLGAPVSTEFGQPLTAAALANRRRDIFRCLVEAGADPRQRLESPVSPTFLAAMPSGGVRRYLAEEAGVTLLMLASGLGWAEEVQLLIEKGAERKALTTGRARVEALHFAACSQNTSTLHALFAGAPSVERLRVVVSLKAQRATVYREGGVLLKTEVSTGRPGFPTPTGEFVVTDKHPQHMSTIYKQPMPFFMRLNFREFGLHSGITTEPYASHGCIRLPDGVARRLFSELPLGTWVRIDP
jgi:ankyrin repeat protein